MSETRQDEASGLARCPRCGYDLTGNASGVCPECGLDVGDGEVARGWLLAWEGKGGVVGRWWRTARRAMRPSRLADAAAFPLSRAAARRFRRVTWLVLLPMVLWLPVLLTLGAREGLEDHGPVAQATSMLGGGGVYGGWPEDVDGWVGWAFEPALLWVIGAGQWPTLTVAGAWLLAMLLGVPAAVLGRVPGLEASRREEAVTLGTYLPGATPLWLGLVAGAVLLGLAAMAAGEAVVGGRWSNSAGAVVVLAVIGSVCGLLGLVAFGWWLTGPALLARRAGGGSTAALLTGAMSVGLALLAAAVVATVVPLAAGAVTVAWHYW